MEKAQPVESKPEQTSFDAIASQGLAEVISLPLRPTRVYERDILPTSLAGGRILLDHMSHELKVDGITHELTLTELRIFELLITNRHRVLNKEQMSVRLYGANITTGTPAVYIGYLRKKLGLSLRGVIKTKRGQGYIIEDSAAEDSLPEAPINQENAASDVVRESFSSSVDPIRWMITEFNARFPEG